MSFCLEILNQYLPSTTTHTCERVHTHTHILTHTHSLTHTLSLPPHPLSLLHIPHAFQNSLKWFFRKHLLLTDMPHFLCPRIFILPLALTPEKRKSNLQGKSETNSGKAEILMGVSRRLYVCRSSIQANPKSQVPIWLWSYV